MRKLFRISHLLLLSALLLSACNLPLAGGVGEPTGEAGVIQTAAAQTVQALQTQIATQSQTTPEPVASETPVPQETVQVPPTAAVATNTSIPPLPSLTPVTVVTSVPCDRASFVSDVTVPDGTRMDPGEEFTKTWRLKNNGTCAWTQSYKLVFQSGDSMGAPASVAMPATIDPGETVDLSVKMKAPTTPKQYQANFMLQNASGKNFGVGSAATSTFWVKIIVGGTPTVDYFAVTSVSYSQSEAGDCPDKTLTFKAKITVSQAGTVTYAWKRSDSTTTTTKSVVFDAAGAKTVTTTWKPDTQPFTGWVALYVDNPNNQTFNKLNFEITCP